MEIHLALSTILGCMHVHSIQQTLWIRAEEVVSWQAVQVCDLGVAGSYHESAEFRTHIDMVSKAPGFLCCDSRYTLWRGHPISATVFLLQIRVRHSYTGVEERVSMVSSRNLPR